MGRGAGYDPGTVAQETLATAVVATLGVLFICVVGWRRAQARKTEDDSLRHVEYTPSTSEALGDFSREELLAEVAAAQAAVDEARKLTVQFKWQAAVARNEARRVNRILNAFAVMVNYSVDKN